MGTRIVGASLLIACFVHGILPAHAESLEAFTRRNLTSSVNPSDFHPQGHYILFIGNDSVTLNANQLLTLHQKNKSMGVKQEILDFKILSKYETGNIVSVVVKAKIRSRVGASEGIGEIVSHDILLHQGGRWVSVFSLGRQ